jgi:hypothetical protein
MDEYADDQIEEWTREDLLNSPLLSTEEVEQLRKSKKELTQYGKEKIRKLMNKEPTREEMIEIAAEREEANKSLLAKVSEEDYQKVQEELERQRLAKKEFKDLTDQERIKLALEELDWIVIGGQDGEEFYGSIQFIRRVLKSFR